VIKRLNPVTGELFKRGDRDDQGRYFLHYRTDNLKDDKYISEFWTSSEGWNKINADNKKYIRKKSDVNFKKYKAGILKKRINPDTGKPFKLGDRNENGQYFIKYDLRTVERESFVREHFSDFATFHNACIQIAFSKSRERAKAKKRPHTVTKDYITSIFPSDFTCPVLGILMSWKGLNSKDSPSLDRINNDNGYVEGNLAWISNRANQIKSNSSYQELKMLVTYLEQIP
jgi:hypothetical protein